MTPRPLIVGLGGTTRAGSSAEKALLTVLGRAAELGCDTLAFGADAMPEEMFDPNRTERSERARALVDALRRADGIVIVTPAYHGGISGLIKNALDFAEDLRTDTRVYFEGRAVGCVVCAEGPQAIGATIASLRAVVHSLRGWPTPYAAAINTRNKPFGSEGQPADPTAIEACHTVAHEVVQFARLARATQTAPHDAR